jgi:hypothetical protein
MWPFRRHPKIELPPFPSGYQIPDAPQGVTDGRFFLYRNAMYRAENARRWLREEEAKYFEKLADQYLNMSPPKSLRDRS